MRVAACPNPAALERLFLGGLPAAEAETLEEHVLECDACSARLDELFRAKETLATVLCEKAGGASSASHPVVDELIRKVESLRPAQEALPQGKAMIAISCTSCQKKLSVKENLAGKKVKCPGCGQLVAVPAAVAVGPAGREDMRTLPPASSSELSADAPSQIDPCAAPTHPPSEKPDATMAIQPVPHHESSLTDFLAPPQTADELGRLGKYRILKILGHGGMGVVYKAEDTMLKRSVAIKAMLPALAASASAGKRFLREAQTMAAVKHDHVANIYDVGEDRGVPFLAMEFLIGEPLDDRLKREEKLPLEETLRIGREIADGLGAAHATGLIHRDIKPANIWLEDRSPSRARQEAGTGNPLPDGRGSDGRGSVGRVKILDFGLARAASQEAGLTQQGAIIGTPAYMSPEQGRGDDVDARTDLFSLGVVLYRMCTAQQPFVGKDTVSTLMAVAMTDPTPPIKVNKALPKELSELVMKLLEKDPAKRVGSAAEVVQAIGAIEKKLAWQKLQEDKTEAINAGDPQHGIKKGAPRDKPARKAAKSSPQASPANQRGPVAKSRRPLVIAAVLFLLMVLCGGVGTFGIIRFSTPEGDFVVNTDDPDFKFSVSKGTVILEDAKTKRTYKLKAERKGNGEYELDVTDVGADLSFKVKQFTIKRGEQFALKATFEPRQVAGAFPPLDPDWLKAVAALPADKQVEAVKAELMKRNPGFDGDMLKVIRGKVVWEINFATDKVTDVSPVRALPEIRHFGCSGPWSKDGKGAPLTDLSPLKGMEKLTNLYCNQTQVSDLTPLKDLKLAALHVGGTNVSDLSPIKDLPLTFLKCTGTKVTDFSPLKGMPLKTLICDFQKERDAAILRSIKTLETINDKPAAQFWAEVDGTAPAVWSLDFAENGRVDLPSLALTKVDEPLTVEAWVTPGVQTSNKNTVFRVGWIHLGIASDTHKWSLWLPQSNPKQKDPWRGFWSDQAFSPGKRTHVAAVWSGKEIDLFVNGQLQGDHDAVMVPKEFNPRFVLGEMFKGQFHQFRVSKTRRYKGRTAPISDRFDSDDKTLLLYRFDEGQGDKLTDLSGNGHHGKIVGAKWVKMETPRQDGKYVLRFTGADTATAPSIKLDPRGPITIEAYVRCDSVVPGKAYSPLLLGVPGSLTIYLEHDGSDLRAGCKLADKEFYRVVRKDVWNFGQRYHLAAVRIKDRCTLYVDGKEVGRKGLPDLELFPPQGPFQIGGRINGEISEVRVSNMARYKGTFTPQKRFEPDKDTIALYHCDEGAGDVLKDSSGNGHHGKIVGAKWVKVDLAPVAKAPGPWRPLLDAELSQWWINDNKQPDAITITELEGEPSLRLRRSAKSAHITTKRWDIKNNHLQLEFQFTGKEAGAFFAAYGWGENGISGIQFDVANDGKTRGYFYGARCAGAHLERGVIVANGNIKGPDVNFAPASLNPGGVWNRLDLVRVEDRVAFFVNGRFVGALAEIRGVKDGKETEVGATSISLRCQNGETLIRRIEVRDISALPPELLTQAPFPPLDPAWLKAVAAMKAEQQIEAVKAELMKRNPGFDGTWKPVVNQAGAVTEVQLSADNVGDLSPLRAFPALWSLSCGGPNGPGGPRGKLADLSPLKGMKLTHLWVPNNKLLSDLTPLKDMKLTFLVAYHTSIADLAPLAGMKLTLLDCGFTRVTDLTPITGLPLTSLLIDGTDFADLALLKDMPLTELSCIGLHAGGAQGKIASLAPLQGMKLTQLRIANQPQIRDLTPLKGMPLTQLFFYHTAVDDLAPLVGMPLTELNCGYTKVTDLTPLKDMPLKNLWCDYRAERDAAILRSIKTLKTINDKSAAEVLNRPSASAAPPLDPAWLKAVAAMKPEQQIEAVKAELMKRNPGFDGKSVTYNADKAGGVTELGFLTNNVADISPVRALPGLRTLNIGGSGEWGQRNGKLADLSPLKDMKLTHLNCSGTPVSDLSPLKDMRLTWLSCSETKVSDLSPVREMKLDHLYCQNTPIANLTPLAKMPLTFLWCRGTQVSDLSPLKGMPLIDITCDFEKERDAEILRSIPTLVKINGKGAKEILK